MQINCRNSELDDVKPYPIAVSNFVLLTCKLLVKEFYLYLTQLWYVEL